MKQSNFLVCRFTITLPDNNTSSICTHRCSSVCIAMVAVMGVTTTDTLYFHFFISFSVSFWGRGAIFWAAITSLLLEENHYSIGTFKEKSFVGNSVFNSLHLTLTMITYPHC